MKKILAVAVVAWAVAGTMVTTGLAGSLTFKDVSSSGYFVYDEFGTKVPRANNWVIALYEDVSKDGSDGWTPGAGDPTGDDTLLYISTTGGKNPWTVAGAFSTYTDVVNGMRVFARVFNATDFIDDLNTGSVTKYADLGAWTLTDPAPDNMYFTVVDPDGNALLDWSTSGTSGGAGDWQPIPEPASLALFGLGLMTLAARKHFRK